MIVVVLRWARAVVLVVSVLALASCGGDGSEPVPATVEEYTTTVPPRGRALTDWQQASSQLCTEFIPRIEAVVDGLGAEPSPDELAVAAGRLIDLDLRFLDRLLAIPVPTERTRSVEQVNDRLRRARQQTEALVSSIARNDYGGVLSARGVLINYTDTNDLYESLDVPECVVAE
jgi:hypothetical protein